MNLAKGFFDTAKSDFKSAKILHENGEYPNAIFFLQQGVEKLAKSYGLFNQIVKVEKIETEISHNPKKVFTKQIAAQQREFDKASEIEKIFPDLFKFQINEEEIDLTGYNKKFRKATKTLIHLDPKDFQWISDEDFDIIKNRINEIETDIEINFDDIRKDFPNLFNNLIQQIEVKTGKNLDEVKSIFNDEKSLELIEDLAKEIIPLSLKSIKVYLSLFFFSLITSEHNQLTRYPCICCGETPKGNYGKEETLVKRYDEIHEIMMNTVELFEEIFIKKEASLQQSV